MKAEHIGKVKEELELLLMEIDSHNHTLYGERYMRAERDKELTTKGVKVLTQSLLDVIYYITH